MVMAAVVGGGVVVTPTVGWLVGPCVVPAACFAGAAVVAGGMLVGSSPSTAHIPSMQAPLPSLQCVPSLTLPLG